MNSTVSPLFPPCYIVCRAFQSSASSPYALLRLLGSAPFLVCIVSWATVLSFRPAARLCLEGAPPSSGNFYRGTID